MRFYYLLSLLTLAILAGSGKLPDAGLAAQTNIYILGNATPVGWDIAAPEPLSPDPVNPDLFTWTGPLIEGEFKFPLFTGDWCDGQWINASVANQSLDSTSFMYTQGCDGPDYKWLVTAETVGIYHITINLTDESIVIERITSETEVTKSGIRLFPNPATTHLFVDAGTLPITEICLYDLRGRLLFCQPPPPANTPIPLPAGMPDGCYLAVLQTPQQFFSRMVLKH